MTWCHDNGKADLGVGAPQTPFPAIWARLGDNALVMCQLPHSVFQEMRIPITQSVFVSPQAPVLHQTPRSPPSKTTMSHIQPYNISIPQAQIDNLKQKLSLASFPDEFEDAGWDLGCPLTDIKRLAKAWVEWDWRQAEKKLNAYPQFHTDIEVDGFGTLDLHFVYQKSEAKDAIPLLFVHGCRFPSRRF